MKHTILLDTSLIRKAAKVDQRSVKLRTYKWGDHLRLVWDIFAIPKQLKGHELKARQDVVAFGSLIAASERGEIAFARSPVVTFELGNDLSYFAHNVLFHLADGGPALCSPTINPSIIGRGERKVRRIVPRGESLMLENKDRPSAIRSDIRLFEGGDWQEFSAEISDKHIVDSFLAWSADKGGCEYYVTGDYKFINFYKSYPQFRQLNINAVTASQLADILALPKVPDDWNFTLRSRIHQQRCYDAGTVVLPRGKLALLKACLGRKYQYYPPADEHFQLPPEHVHRAVVEHYVELLQARSARTPSNG